MIHVLICIAIGLLVWLAIAIALMVGGIGLYFLGAVISEVWGGPPPRMVVVASASFMAAVLLFVSLEIGGQIQDNGLWVTLRIAK